jgi:hypothetical protein
MNLPRSIGSIVLQTQLQMKHTKLLQENILREERIASVLCAKFKGRATGWTLDGGRYSAMSWHQIIKSFHDLSLVQDSIKTELFHTPGLWQRDQSQ